MLQTLAQELQTWLIPEDHSNIDHCNNGTFFLRHLKELAETICPSYRSDILWENFSILKTARGIKDAKMKTDK